MTRLRLALAALALTGALAVISVDAKPAAAAATADCNVMRWNNPTGMLGCYDRSANAIHLYSASGYWGGFPTNGGLLTCTPNGVWSGWTVSSATITRVPAAPIATFQDAGQNGCQTLAFWGGNHDYLEWWAGSGAKFGVTN